MVKKFRYVTYKLTNGCNKSLMKKINIDEYMGIPSEHSDVVTILE